MPPLINAGVFTAVALLPHTTTCTSSGPISKIINSRVHWDIAWLVTLASTGLTAGAVVLFSSKKRRSSIST